MASLRPPAPLDWTAILDGLGALTNSITARSLYGERHPAIARADDATMASFAPLLEDTPTILVALVDGELVICERPAPGLRERLHVLASAMTRHEIEAIVLQRGLTRAECETLAGALASSADVSGLVRERAQASLVHVLLRFLVVGVGGGNKATSAAVGDTDLVPRVGEVLRRVTESLLAEEMVDRAAVLDGARAVVSAVQARAFRLSQRSRTGSRDDEVAHAANVAVMTAAMALEARYPVEVCADATAAAMLHDIGYVFLPDEIRRVPSPLLTGDALDRHRRHPEGGALALLLAGCPALWVAAALDHHRGVDGKGFPTTASNGPPHELVRMIALASFMDRKRTAVGDGGPSREDPDAALQLAASLEARYFGPPLVRLFVRALGVFPPGTTVELSSRQAAIVTAVNAADGWRPQVKLLTGPERDKLVELRDVSALEGRHELSIVRAIPPPIVPLTGAIAAQAAAAPVVPTETQMEAASPWRPTQRPRREATSIERLLEDVLAPSPSAPPPSVPARPAIVPPRATSITPVARPSSPMPIAPPPSPVPLGRITSPVPRPSVPSFRPPPVISERPSPPSDPPPGDRFRRPVSDLPAPLDKPAPKAKDDDLRAQLLAFLDEDAPAQPPSRAAVAPKTPKKGADAALEDELRAFLGGGSATLPARRGSLIPVPVASADVVAKQAGLDPRAGFILMMMDGASSLDEVIDACGLPADEAMQIVDDLTARGLVELRDRSRRA